MFVITKKHLSRRTVLRGMGAAVSLPLLDAMIPAHTALANTAAAPLVHLAFVYFPHGAIMFPGNDHWTPSGEGTDFKLSRILSPLAPYQGQLTVVSGLGNKPAESSAVHAIVPGTWLSCVHPHEGQTANGAITVDQIAALQIGQSTPLPSLEVAAEAGGGAGVCDRNYGCSYSGTIAFRNPTTPLPMENNPRKLFQQLFGEGDNATDRKLIGAQYGSILDMTATDAKALAMRVGPRDRALLDDYLETVREIERRVQKIGQQSLSGMQLPPTPAGIPDSFPEQQALMFDLIALAWQAKLTRIATYMMAAEVSQMTYGFIGVPDAFHPVSHHQGDPVKLEKLVKIQQYHTGVLKKFLDRLAATPDGEGSLLDHSIIVYGSNMGNSNAHNQFPLPTAILGHGCGKIKGGQHLRYPDHTPLSNLLLTVLDRAGVKQDKLGDASGTFAEV